jgi:hypothetical protein
MTSFQGGRRYTPSASSSSSRKKSPKKKQTIQQGKGKAMQPIGMKHSPEPDKPQEPEQNPSKQKDKEEGEEGEKSEEELAKLQAEEAKLKQKLEETRQHASGVIPPPAPAPSIQELMGGKKEDK